MAAPASDCAGPGDVVVVGAGAAGLLAAIFAARAGARVRLLETRRQPGAKIRVSGGGRCNVLPSTVSTADYSTSGSPRSMRNVLLSWPLEEVRAFFERDLGIELRAEPNGKVFPRSDDAREVVDALLAAVRDAGVRLRGEARVERLQPRSADGSVPRWRLTLAGGEELGADRVILATGGLSLPRTGSDGGGLEIARALGHTIVPLHPVLVPLTTPDPRWRSLPGVSVRARLRAVRDAGMVAEREGDLLFTHRGFSGPVVLDISEAFTRADPSDVELRVQWVGDDETTGGSLDAWLARGGPRPVGASLRELSLPRRLIERILEDAGIGTGTRLCDLRREARRRLTQALGDATLPVDGSEGYRTAEATGGGVPLSEIRVRSLESRLCPGLHFAGEMLDVTGRIGGYNFLWAWVTGKKAGEGAAGEGASG